MKYKKKIKIVLFGINELTCLHIKTALEFVHDKAIIKGL